jgi:Protein of unknown function (DUF2807).
MKVKGLLFVICLLFALNVVAKTETGNGKIITKEIKVMPYESILIGKGIEKPSKGLFFFRKDYESRFIYSQVEGDSKFSITIDENLLPLLNISSSNGKLVVEVAKRGGKIKPTQFIIESSSEKLNKIDITGTVDFYVQSPLTSYRLEVSVSGVGDIEFKDAVKVNTLDISVSGVGDFSAEDLVAEDVSVNISGVGDATLAGKANNATLTVSGVGDIHAYGLEAKTATASASGVGDVEVYATETLKANASGVGDVEYKGNPTLTSKASGIGSVTKKD